MERRGGLDVPVCLCRRSTRGWSNENLSAQVAFLRVPPLCTRTIMGHARAFLRFLTGAVGRHATGPYPRKPADAPHVPSAFACPVASQIAPRGHVPPGKAAHAPKSQSTGRSTSLAYCVLHRQSHKGPYTYGRSYTTLIRTRSTTRTYYGPSNCNPGNTIHTATRPRPAPLVTPVSTRTTHPYIISIEGIDSERISRRFFVILRTTWW